MYTHPEKKIITGRELLTNLFNEIIKQNTPATMDLFSSLARIIENEIVHKKSTQGIPLKSLVQFVTKNK